MGAALTGQGAGGKLRAARDALAGVQGERAAAVSPIPRMAAPPMERSTNCHHEKF
jgi:hypothetical protein